MYAEYSGLVFNEKGYMDSLVFLKILEEAKRFLDEKTDREQQLHAIGTYFLEHYKKEQSHLVSIKNSLGEDWKTLRFRNLVRLGADIESSGLGSLSRATLMGVLLYQKEKYCEVKNGILTGSD